MPSNHLPRIVWTTHWPMEQRWTEQTFQGLPEECHIPFSQLEALATDRDT